jgi:hypothetical protein
MAEETQICDEKKTNINKAIKTMGQYLRSMKYNHRIGEDDFLFLIDQLGRIQKCPKLQRIE